MVWGVDGWVASLEYFLPVALITPPAAHPPPQASQGPFMQQPSLRLHPFCEARGSPFTSSRVHPQCLAGRDPD